MSGNIAGRKRTWPWVVLSVLFALTFVWSSAQDGGVWTILRIGSGVALGLSLVLIVLVSIRSRRLRHAQQGDEEGTTDALNVEDALGDDGAGHQRADVGAEVGHHRDERVAQQVDTDHTALGQALGDGGAHVVRAQVLGDGGTGEPRHVRQ